MIALSLWEPWASAMALGIKVNETRSYWTGVRGDVAIHAAKKPMDRDARETWDIFLKPAGAVEPQYGKIVCVVEIEEVVPSEVFRDAKLPLTSEEAALGDYSERRWVWRTTNLRRLQTPVPARGYQGFWYLTHSQEADVKAILNGTRSVH